MTGSPSTGPAPDFVVFCEGRTGSTHLTGLLDSHPQIHCDCEIIPPAGPHASYFGPLESKIEFLRERKLAAGGKLYGFKFTVHMRNEEPGLLQHFLTHGTRFLLLRRGNAVDHFVSMKLAQLNQNWESRTAYKTQQLTIDVQELRAFADAQESINQRLERESSANPQFVLDYEELNSPDRLNAALHFLGVKPQPLSSPYRRCRTASLPEIVLNYDEVALSLQGTPLERFMPSRNRWRKTRNWLGSLPSSPRRLADWLRRSA